MRASLLVPQGAVEGADGWTGSACTRAPLWVSLAMLPCILEYDPLPVLNGCRRGVVILGIARKLKRVLMALVIAREPLCGYHCSCYWPHISSVTAASSTLRLQWGVVFPRNTPANRRCAVTLWGLRSRWSLAHLRR
jgi:hypothetical protein